MRRLGALRVAARIARRDARRAKGRTVLVAVLVGLPVLAGTAGAALLDSTVPTDATYARYVLGPEGVAREEVQARIGMFTGWELVQSVRGDWSGGVDIPRDDPTVAEHERTLTGALPDGDRVVRVVRGEAAFSTPDRAVPSTTSVVSLPTDGDLSGIHPVDDGVLPTSPDEIALSRRTAERLGAEVGDVVTMEADGEARTTTVTGLLAQTYETPHVVAGPGALTGPETAGIDPAMWRAGVVAYDWYVVGPVPVTWDDVLAVNRLGSVVTSRAVLLHPPAPHEVPYLSAGSPSMDSGTLALGGGIAAVILLEAVLLIGPAFAVGARRNERQLALLAASGAERRTLRHVVLLTGVVTGLAAAGGGVVIGLATAAGVRAVVGALVNPFVFPDLRVPWLVVAGFVLFGTLSASLAAWIPSRRAARVDVVAALAGRRPPVRHGRRLAVVGGVVAVLGLVAAVVGATASEPMVLVAGVIALELGIVAGVGALIGLVALLAPRLGAVGRIALRDASRNRSRTAPAVAAVVAAVAGITAGALYLQSGEDYQARQYAPFGAVGTVAVHVPTAETMDQGDLEAMFATATVALEQHLPVTDVQRVALAAPIVDTGGNRPEIATRIPPENLCPLWGPDYASLSGPERDGLADDHRCQQDFGGGGQVAWMAASGADTLADDGAVVGALGFDGSARAAQALAEGRAVVRSPLEVQDDGTVHVVVTIHGQEGEPEVIAEGDVPAEVVDLPGVQYGLVLPPQALEGLGLRAQPVGLVAGVSRPPSPAEESAVAAALGPEVLVHVEGGNPFGRPSMALLLLVAAAVVVGLAATGISVALTAAEARPDLATLAAIGAEPRTRRRFTAAQAGVISGIGTTLGVLAGLALGWVLVTAQRYRWDVPDHDWQLSVPWPTVVGIAVCVPLLATAVGYVATRSRLPLVRRIAG